MMAAVLAPLVKAAWMRLMPSTPTASCCSCAVLSSIRMCITTVLGSALQQSGILHLAGLGHTMAAIQHQALQDCKQGCAVIADEHSSLVGHPLQMQQHWVCKTHRGELWYFKPSQPWHSLSLLNACNKIVVLVVRHREKVREHWQHQAS